MSFCLACAEWAGSRSLCKSCGHDLEPGSQWRLPSGVLIAGALRHRGAARRLVHRLKYQGVTEVADLLAGFMARHLPSDAGAVVPVPRARLRLMRYGVDPALELARALAGRTGLRVERPLAATLWWPRHALRSRDGRGPPPFQVADSPTPGSVLVDDVATSGATLQAASAALGSDFRHGIVATAPGRVRVPAPTEAGEVAWRYDRT